MSRSLAAQFYVSDHPLDDGIARPRGLYTNTGQQNLLRTYRGADSQWVDREDSELLMTEAERQEFAEELSRQERDLLQCESAPHGSSPHYGSSKKKTPSPLREKSLQQYFDPSTMASLHSQQDEGSCTMYVKNEKWKDYVDRKHDIIREQLRAQEASECTFRPAINRGSQRSDPESQRYEMSVEERLLRFEEEKRKRIAMRTSQYQQSSTKECTFRPKTVKCAWTDNVIPRYLDEAGPMNTPRKHLIEEAVRKKREEIDQECTFRPEVNHSIRGIESSGRVENYLNTPVHLRLHREAVSMMERKRRQQQLTTGRVDLQAPKAANKAQYTSLPEADTTVSSIGAATASLEVEAQRKAVLLSQFHQRNKATQERKHRKVEEIRAEQNAQCTFHPVTAPYAGDPTTRNGMQRTIVRSEERDEPSFTPRINKESEKLVKEKFGERTVEHLLEFQNKSLSRKERQKAEEAESESRAFTFSPQISRFAENVEGKIVPNTKSIEDYKRFVAMQRRIRQRDVEMHLRDKKEGQRSEDEDCTFTPQINTVPSYIQDIARELREIRQLQDGGKRSGSRPGFRF